MRLAIFDLDNTLIDRDVSFHRWTAELVAEHRLDPSERQWLATADEGGFAPRPRFLSAVRDRYGLDEPVETMLDRYRERIVELFDPDPRVPPALDQLRAAGWRVAIATNGDVRQQRAKIRRANLDGSVDAVVISDGIGVAKPDLRIFELAAARCGESLANGGWMVGDCPTRDIGGGRGAGLRTIWMRRGRTWDASAPAPDAIVDDLPQTIPVLTGAAESGRWTRGNGTPR